VGDGDTAADDSAVLAALSSRVAELEEQMSRMHRELATHRLVLRDTKSRERLVAEVVDDILEVRIELPPAQTGRRTALLGFSAPRHGELAAGIGVQLWAEGDIVNELCWWEDAEIDDL
jgi:hypothetical protein